MTRSTLLAGAFAAAVVLAACSGGSTATSTTAPPSTAAPTTEAAAPSTSSTTSTTFPDPGTTSAAAYDHLVATSEYGPGLALDVHSLPGTEERPVVVTVHGGGWYGGSRSSLGPLADSLAARGLVAVNVSYRTGSAGGGFPATFEDVTCAIGAAVEAARPYTTTPEDVIVTGHSAGAHLGAVAWLTDTFAAGCTSVEPTGFVGLAGPYDTNQLAFVLEPFFGTDPDEDPGPWEAGNPLTYAGERPESPALIVHGDADGVVDPFFSEEFAAALEEGGHQVEYLLLPGIDPGAVAGPLVAADLIADFALDR